MLDKARHGSGQKLAARSPTTAPPQGGPSPATGQRSWRVISAHSALKLRAALDVVASGQPDLGCPLGVGLRGAAGRDGTVCGPGQGCLMGLRPSCRLEGCGRVVSRMHIRSPHVESWRSKLRLSADGEFPRGRKHQGEPPAQAGDGLLCEQRLRVPWLSSPIP